MAFCTGEKVDTLEAAYRRLCENNEDFTKPENAPLEEDEIDVPVEKAPEAGMECMDFLTQLQGESKDLREINAQEGEEAGTSDIQLVDVLESDLRKAPDRNELSRLIDKESVMEPFRDESSRSPQYQKELDHLPSTLAEAMALKGDRVNAIWRLCVRLRAAKGGSDITFVRNPRNCRRASKGLNWHQSLDYFRICMQCAYVLYCFVPFLSVL